MFRHLLDKQHNSGDKPSMRTRVARGEQAYFVALLDGYILPFIVSVGTQDDLPRIEAELKNLRFQ